MANWQDHPLREPAAVWPYSIGDEVRAVHFSLDKDCPYSWPENCEIEERAKRYINSYKQWLKYRGIDIDELLSLRKQEL